MLLLLGLLLALVMGSLVLLMPTLWAHATYSEYRDSRPVTCPENGQQVSVSFDALHAALTGLKKSPDLRLRDCTRWPERIRCGQDCIPDARRTEPYTRGEVQVRTKRIYHLPILIAAFASWYVGAVWHSHYLFRTRWMTDLGLTPGQLKTLVLWYSPHLLSMTVCLLFAYGVAWLLAVVGRKGIVNGLFASFFLWGAVLLVSLPSVVSLSRDLLLLEVVYSFLVALVTGSVIGGLSGKLVLSSQEHWPTDPRAARARS